MSRRSRFEQLESRRLLAADWMNPIDALDVNADDSVSAVDALLVVNVLNHSGGLDAAQLEAMDAQYFYDTDGDDHISAVDALKVINELNGEGETSPPASTQAASNVRVEIRNRHLFIHGSDEADNVKVQGTGDGDVSVSIGDNTLLNGSTQPITATGIRYIRVFFNDGNDSLEVGNVSGLRDILVENRKGNLALSIADSEFTEQLRVRSFHGAATIELDQVAIGRETHIVAHHENSSINISNVTTGGAINVFTFEGDDAVKLDNVSARFIGLRTHEGNDEVSAVDVTVADDLVVMTGPGNDGAPNQPIELLGISANDAIIVDLGPGGDYLYLGEVLDSRFASIISGPGDDSVVVEDVVNRDRLFVAAGAGHDSLGLVELENGALEVHTHGGQDRIYAEQVASRQLARFFTGDQEDFLNIDSVVTPRLFIHAGGDADEIQLNEAKVAEVLEIVGAGGADIVSNLIGGAEVAIDRLSGAVQGAIEDVQRKIDELIDTLVMAGLGFIDTDSDGDNLSDRQERRLKTDPMKFDTDGDLLGDGFEANSKNLDPLKPDDPNGDPDADQLTNLDEQIFETDPDNPDSDGDGTNDGTEANQGSNPNDAADMGTPPPAEELVELDLTVGDHSGSHSERYNLRVGNVIHQAPEFGVVRTRAYKFRRGMSYPIAIFHRGSNLGRPDYDYTARIQAKDGSQVIIVEDPDGIMGVHGESDPFFAAGKTATLHIPFVSVETVSFEGTNGTVLMDADGTAYAAPHWESGSPNANEPISFTRDKTVSLTAMLKAEPSDLFKNATVKIDGPGNLDFEGKASNTSGGIEVKSLAADNKLPNQVDLIDLQLQWQVEIQLQDGTKNLLPAGTTRNELYVGLADPRTSDLYETVLDIGARNAKGSNSEDAVIAAIWSDFESPLPGVVRRDGTSMTYWNNNVAPGSCQRLIGLVATSNGSCLAWSELLMTTVAAQGISGAQLYELQANTTVNPGAGGFLVKNWTFQGNGDGARRYPYVVNTDVFSDNGIAGQGNSNPPPAFFNHYIVKLKGLYYDPSYGAGPFATEAEHENAAIDGIYAEIGGELRAKKADPAISELTYFAV